MANDESLLPRRSPGHNLVRFLLFPALRAFFRLYGRWKVIGLENIPRTGPVLFAANHASYIDPVLLWAAVYRNRRGWGIARDDLWHNRIVGYALDSIGVIPVKRGSADRTALRRALEVLARGEVIGIFPEGTRTLDGNLQPAQPGIALLAQKSGAPIVPVALLGTYEMLPAKRKSIRRVPLTVAFGKPLVFRQESTREEITTAVMQSIADLIAANRGNIFRQD